MTHVQDSFVFPFHHTILVWHVQLNKLLVDIMLFILIVEHFTSVFTTSIITKDAIGTFELFFNVSLEILKHAKNTTFAFQK